MIVHDEGGHDHARPGRGLSPKSAEVAMCRVVKRPAGQLCPAADPRLCVRAESSGRRVRCRRGLPAGEPSDVVDARGTRTGYPSDCTRGRSSMFGRRMSTKPKRGQGPDSVWARAGSPPACTHYADDRSSDGLARKRSGRLLPAAATEAETGPRSYACNQAGVRRSLRLSRPNTRVCTTSVIRHADGAVVQQTRKICPMGV